MWHHCALDWACTYHCFLFPSLGGFRWNLWGIFAFDDRLEMPFNISDFDVQYVDMMIFPFTL